MVILNQIKSDRKRIKNTGGNVEIVVTNGKPHPVIGSWVAIVQDVQDE